MRWVVLALLLCACEAGPTLYRHPMGVCAVIYERGDAMRAIAVDCPVNERLIDLDEGDASVRVVVVPMPVPVYLPAPPAEALEPAP